MEFKLTISRVLNEKQETAVNEVLDDCNKWEKGGYIIVTGVNEANYPHFTSYTKNGGLSGPCKGHGIHFKLINEGGNMPLNNVAQDLKNTKLTPEERLLIENSITDNNGNL